MSIVIPNESEQNLLNRILSVDSPVLKLFKSNTTPDEDTLLGDLTEVTEDGYAAITLTSESWTVNTISGTTTASYAEQNFNIEEAVTIYGAYVTNSAGDELLWLERFDEACEIITTGDVNVTATINLG